MVTRRQFFANSLVTVAGLNFGEWILSPMTYASDDKDTVKLIQYDDSGQKVGPIRVKKMHKTDYDRSQVHSGPADPVSDSNRPMVGRHGCCRG